MARRYVVPAFVLAVVVGGAAAVISSGSAGIAFAEPAPAATAPASAPAATTPAASVTAPVAASPKVAEVAGEAITKNDVEQLYNAIKQRAGEAAPPMDKVFWMLADQIVASRLIIAQAKAQNLDATPDVQNALKMAHEQILQEAYVRKLFTGLDSDESLKPRYDAMVAAYKGQEEVRARHILVETEEEAKALLAKLAAGGDFAKIAQESSKDPGSKDQGGDLGFFAQDAMVPEFAAAAFALQPGKMVDAPVKTQFGWHIIKVEERRARQAPPMAEVKQQLLAEAQQEKLQETIAALRAAADVKRFPAEGVPPVPTDAPTPAAAPGTAPATP